LLGSNAASQGFQSGSFIGLDTTNATGGSFTQGNAIVNSSGAGGGAVGLKKLGTGTLVLDKTNTYTGATTVSAGGLLVNGSITSAVTVNAGTFGGGGSSTGNITVGTGAGAGAIFAPGNNAVGSFTTTGSVSLLSDATYALEFDSSTGNFDKIVASGLTLASGETHLAIADIAGTSAALTVGNTYTIFDGTSTSISGTFFGLADNSTITVGLNTFTINYNAGLDSRDIVLTVVTAIPEPSTYALLGAVGCLGCAALRRQGRRSGSPE
jgi:fibronectin-binding autotransporter adhesin